MIDRQDQDRKREGKQGKYCPFREGHKCGDFCGLWCDGMKCCVFHGLNANLRVLANPGRTKKSGKKDNNISQNQDGEGKVGVINADAV